MFKFTFNNRSMDLKRLLAKTTKPVLVNSRAGSGSATSERKDEKHPEQYHDNDRENDIKQTVSNMKSVLHSFNRMKLIRQRTLAAKGNITTDVPMRKFSTEDVTTELNRILTTTLTGMTYDPKRAGLLSKSLSESIKKKVKTMKFPRYKFVVMVTITSKSDQSILIGSQYLWNTDTDSYAQGHYSNSSLIAVATVFAIFQE